MSDLVLFGLLEMLDRMKICGFFLKYWMGFFMLMNGFGYYELLVEMVVELLIGKGICIYYIGDFMFELKVE